MASGALGDRDPVEALPAAMLWSETILGHWIRGAGRLPGDPESVHMLPSLERHMGTVNLEARLRRLPGDADVEAVAEMADVYVRSLEDLLDILPPRLLPEVGSNLSFALPGAGDTGQVLALDSRIVQAGGEGSVTCGELEMGGSHHTARIVLAAMSRDPNMRCAMNLRYRPEHVEAARRAQLTVSSFQRSEQPEGVTTMEWGTWRAIELHGGDVPDVIYDEGGPGKEPMLRVLGKDPADVVKKVAVLVSEL
jgi:predicted fused transcriptional regulator/phosphomethylpyrimidine kinase